MASSNCGYCGARKHDEHLGVMYPCPLFGGSLIHEVCCKLDIGDPFTARRHGWSVKEMVDTCNACGKFKEKNWLTGLESRTVEEYHDVDIPSFGEGEAQHLLTRIAFDNGLRKTELMVYLEKNEKPEKMVEIDWVLCVALWKVVKAWEAHNKKKEVDEDEGSTK